MARKAKGERRAARKERARAAREARAQAELDHKERLKRQRIVLVALVVVTAVASAVCYWALDNPRLTGVVLLVGTLVSLFYGLGRLGAGVRARDRNRAGAIDFGNRK